MRVWIKRQTRARIRKEMNGERNGWKREPKSSDCNPLPPLGHTKECNIMSARIRGNTTSTTTPVTSNIVLNRSYHSFISFLIFIFPGYFYGKEKKVVIWTETILNLKIRKDIESIYGGLVNNGIKERRERDEGSLILDDFIVIRTSHASFNMLNS